VPEKNGLDMMTHLVGIDDVRDAARRISGVAHRTPVITCRALDEIAGASVFLKCENFQRVGAFKFRGAYNALSKLDDGAKRRGVVAFSSGNHAQGVALAAQLLGIPATIVMPTDAAKVKLEATRAHGARVVTYDRATESREAIARRIKEERGCTLIPPFDHPDIIAGAGTVGLELVEEVEGLDAVVTPLGGGGLLSGCAIAARASNPAIEVYGVEPEAGDDWSRSKREGRIVHIADPVTIADGLRTTAPGEITWQIAGRLATDFLTVTDAEIRAAMRLLFERVKLVVEPSAAVGVAALMAGKIRANGKRIGVVVSGGNVDLSALPALLAV
jgi:threo-3-hydroxy-L-aspartate ammonia-lyase